MIGKENIYVSEALVSTDFDIQTVMVEGFGGEQRKAYIFEGIFTECNTTNQNKRIYPEEILRREHDRLNGLIGENGGLLMELDHPVIVAETKSDIMRASKVLLDRACGIIRQNFSWEGDKVKAKVEILDDEPLGGKLLSLAKRGWKPGVSSRAIGGAAKFDPVKGAQEVPNDIKFITYDFVENPSVHNARLKQIISEEIQYYKSQQINNKKFWQVLADIGKKHL